MSVNSPNGSSLYFYSQRLKALPNVKQCVPSLAGEVLGGGRGRIWVGAGGGFGWGQGEDLGGGKGRMLKFALMLTSAFHQTLFWTTNLLP
jgi:hypothetical protein